MYINMIFIIVILMLYIQFRYIFFVKRLNNYRNCIIVNIVMIFKLELDGFYLFNLVIVLLIGICMYIFLLLYLMVDNILQWIIFDDGLYFLVDYI